MSGKPSRRAVLQALIATGALHSAGSFAQPVSTSTGWLLIGTNQGKGVYRARWNASTGEIGEPELAVATPQPTYLCLHPHLPVLYACNEADVPAAAVTAFTLDRSSATLTQIATQPTQGGAPCFVSVDQTGRWLFAANYSGGSLAVFPLDAHGAPGPAATVFQCAGNPACGSGGPVKDRQSGPHLHCAVLAPDNRTLLACDLGDDSVLLFPLHPDANTPLGSVHRLPTEPGAGPRHLAFHPNKRWLYCINEINCTVVLYRWLPGGHDQLKPVPDGVVSIRPAGSSQDPTSTGAEIALTRDGRFAYTSTRFSDLLTVFRVDQNSGRLTQVQQLPCGGKTPRFFGLDPTERWLLCGNQDSNTITTFARDGSSGSLTSKGSIPAANPECLLWL